MRGWSSLVKINAACWSLVPWPSLASQCLSRPLSPAALFWEFKVFASQLEDNLLYLHLIEKVITSFGFGQWHDLVKHEPEDGSALASVEQFSIGHRMRSTRTYPNSCCFFSNTAKASGKIPRTGQRPICRRMFLLHCASAKVRAGHWPVVVERGWLTHSHLRH